MDLFKNGVGRPSNETIKKRRMFVASIVLAVAVVLFTGCYALFSIETKNLVGASYYNGNSKIWHNASIKDAKVDSNCKLAINATITNRTNFKINIVRVELKGGSTNKTYDTKTINKTIPAGTGTKAVVSYNFDIKKIPANLTSLGIKVIFKVGNDKRYYTKLESFKLTNKIKQCLKKVGVNNGNNLIYQKANANDIQVDKCNLIIGFGLENRTTNKVDITKMEFYNNNMLFVTSNGKSSIAAGKGKKKVLYATIPVKNIPKNIKRIDVKTYFTLKKAQYYKLESISISSKIENQIEACQNKTTLKTTKKK